jgi:hypothetical protein
LLLNILPFMTGILSRPPISKGCACRTAIARQIVRSGYFPFAFNFAFNSTGHAPASAAGCRRSGVLRLNQ